MAERVLVTGATGFLGSQLVRRLVADGDEVVALVRPKADLWRLEGVVEWVELVRADVTEPPSLQHVDRVFHLAAAGVRAGADARAVVQTNVLGTLATLELAERAGAERFVYCGSCFEYGPGERHREDAVPRPISEYGAAKAAGWLLAHAFARAHGLPVVSVRPFTAYGPYEAAYRLVPSLCLGAVRGEPVELTAGAQTRDFVYVDDVVEALVLASAAEAAVGGTYNACSGVSTPVRTVAETVASLASGPVELRLGALPARAVEFPTLSGDPAAAATALGWRSSTPLDEGLRRTLAWFAEHAERHPEYARAEARR